MAKNLTSVAEIWRSASLVQRIVLLTVLLSCVGGGALLVNWARKPHMDLLYIGLSPEDAAKIVDKIRDADVPYELRSGGTAIYVPENKVNSLRLATASEGLPTSGQVGYKILDGEDLGTSPFTQRVKYRRAIEGELARTIQWMDVVVAARVHVAKPEPSLFLGRQKEASATVALRLRSGHRLGQKDVAAIVHLVAGSIEGLLVDNVVVVDTGGNLLSGQPQDELVKGTNSFLDYKSRVESYLARKAEDMLAVVLGPNRASVRVDAEIQTSSLNETTTTYLPDGKVVTREEEKTKSSTPPPGAGGAATASATKESTSSTEYLVSKKTEDKRDMPGKIMSLSVAAAVDLSSNDEADGAEGGGAPAPKIALEDVEDIIRNAIGLGENDTIKVVSAAFHRPAAAAEEPDEGGFFNRDFLLTMGKRFSLGALVIGALLALKMFGGSKKEAATPALEGAAAGGSNLLTVQELETNPKQLRAQISRALRKNPDEVRKLFLTWAQTEEGEE